MNLSFNHGESRAAVVNFMWSPDDCIECSDLLLDAWERMTTGGLKVPCLPGYPYAHAVETPTLTCAFIADFGPAEWT